MYGFVSEKRPNPIGGHCYNCIYCYVHGLKGMKVWLPNMRKKYSGDFRIYPQYFKRRYKENEIIFFCDCIDWLHQDMPIEIIMKVIKWFSLSPKSTFLSLTKNPVRYFEILEYIPDNVVIGFTCESNINYPDYSDAPLQINRLEAMVELENQSEHKRFMSIEPTLKFDFDIFLDYIERINPNFAVAIGYDNHNYRLDEPELRDIISLKTKLIQYGFNVIDKTIRKAWWE